MTRALHYGLCGLGGFLVAGALLCQLYAAPRLMRTPLDIDTVTILTGDATLMNGETVPVRATSITRVDVAKSDDDVVVFLDATCLVKEQAGAPDCVDAKDPSGRLVYSGVSSYPVDRVSAMGVDDAPYVGGDVVPVSGLLNKWPFEVEKKEYPFWDGQLGRIVPASYDGEETRDGLPTYRFTVRVDRADTEIAPGIQGTYSTEKTFWIEPLTGSVVDVAQSESRWLGSGRLALRTDLRMASESVDAGIHDAHGDRAQLIVLTRVVPIGGYGVGGLALLASTMIRPGPGPRRRRHPADSDPVSGDPGDPRPS